jgi:negative regulator of sigma E activity
MTDHTLLPPDPPEDLDDVVSAYVDGEASAAEIARVEGDPTLVARAAEFAALAGRVGVVPDAPASASDAALTAALAAFDDLRHPAAAAVVDTPVADQPAVQQPAAPLQQLDSAARRASWASRFGPILAAAAAIAVVVGLVGVAGRAGLGGGDDAAESATAGTVDSAAKVEAERSFGASESTAGAGFADNAAPAEASESGGGTSVFLGEFTSVNDLLTTVRADARLASTDGDGAVAPSTSADPAQLASGGAAPPCGVVLVLATATVGGESLIVVADDAVSPPLLRAIRVADCAELGALAR